MKKLRLNFLTVIILPLALGACASVDAAKDTQGSGLTKSYSAGYDAVWIASENAVQNTGGKIVEEDKKQGRIIASYGVSAFSWGERVGIFLKPVSNTTEVEVVSKKAVGVNITAANWEPKIHSKIEENLSKK